MIKLFEVECLNCKKRREELLAQPPELGEFLLCPACDESTPHRRIWALQNVYTWRAPDSPSQRGKPTCKIGES